jgi:hypothetical protein
MLNTITIKELHIHLDGVDCVHEQLAAIEANQTLIKEIIMATKEEVLTAIADEGTEVAAKIAELQAKIDELIAAGTGATAADLEEIKLAVQGIFAPTA